MTSRMRYLLSAALLVFAVAVIYVALHESRRPPHEALAEAYQAIARAERNGASTHAGFRLTEAKQLLSLAESTIARENQAVMPLWSYHFADSLLHEVVRLADRAASDARDSKREIAREMTKKIAGLRNNITYWEQTLDGDLGRTDCQRLLISARLNLQLATDLARDGQVASALSHVDSAKSAITALEHMQDRHDETVDQRRSEAVEWIDETVAYTIKSGKPALVVDKSGHRVMVLQNGRVEKTIPCEVGYNGAYQKRRAGDGATPEGMYKVTEVRKNSKYYRALLLNYPNEQDRERFRKNVSAGAIPAHSKIGGLIEIHGHGGQNEDWTDGCVAVENDDMDYLFDMARVGMPVTIVYGWEYGR